MSIEQTLSERGQRYGEFSGHARITQSLKDIMTGTVGTNWGALRDDQKEALEMIAHKIGRILNGDPDYHDSWHDIVGYAKLVADDILVRQSPKPERENDLKWEKESKAVSEFGESRMKEGPKKASTPMEEAMPINPVPEFGQEQEQAVVKEFAFLVFPRHKRCECLACQSKEVAAEQAGKMKEIEAAHFKAYVAARK